MAFVQATPGLWVNWELKDYPEVCGQDFALRSADGLLRAIADYDLTDRSMLNSFSSEVLEYVAAESCGEMPIHGQGVAPTSRMHGKATRAPQDYWDWACLYTDDHTIPSEPHYAACKALGIQPCVCIKDTLENYQSSVRLGCRRCRNPARTGRYRQTWRGIRIRCACGSRRTAPRGRSG